MSKKKKIKNPKWKKYQVVNNAHQQTKCKQNFQFFTTTTCIILLLYRFALNVFPSWKRWVELKLLRDLAVGERGQLEVKDEKENITLVDRVVEIYGAVCLPAVLKNLEHHSGDMKALWSQNIYTYIPGNWYAATRVFCASRSHKHHSPTPPSNTPLRHHQGHRNMVVTTFLPHHQAHLRHRSPNPPLTSCIGHHQGHRNIVTLNHFLVLW